MRMRSSNTTDNIGEISYRKDVNGRAATCQSGGAVNAGGSRPFGENRSEPPVQIRIAPTPFLSTAHISFRRFNTHASC